MGLGMKNLPLTHQRVKMLFALSPCSSDGQKQERAGLGSCPSNTGHLRHAWPWASHSLFRSLSFPVCRIDPIRPIPDS